MKNKDLMQAKVLHSSQLLMHYWGKKPQKATPVLVCVCFHSQRQKWPNKYERDSLFLQWTYSDILSINLLFPKQMWVRFLLDQKTKGGLINIGLKFKTVTQDWETLSQLSSTMDHKNTIWLASEPVLVFCAPSFTKAGTGFGNSILFWVFLTASTSKF